jgi:hypothetical protein
VGDGKIFVSNLEKVVRIRTGETDQWTLQNPWKHKFRQTTKIRITISKGNRITSY